MLERRPITARGLAVRNFGRWLRAHIVSWGVLGVIYATTLAILMQPVLGAEATSLGEIALINALVLLVPGAIEYVGVHLQRHPLGGPGLRPLVSGRGIIRLWQAHEWRKLSTWACVALAVVLGVGFARVGSPNQSLWIVIAQLPAQRALWSVWRWKDMVLNRDPRSGAARLVVALGLSFVQWMLLSTLLWIEVGIAVGGAVPAGWSVARTGFAVVLAAFANAAVCWEGDSGRPWLVNTIALALGSVAGWLTDALPWSGVLLALLGYRYVQELGLRPLSVARMDEDTLVS